MVPKGQIHQRCTALLQRCTPHTQWDNATCLICANHVHCLYSNCTTDRPSSGLTCQSPSTVHATHSLKGGGCPLNTMGHHRGTLLCHSMLHTDVHQHLKQGRVLRRSIHMAWTSQEKSLRPQTVSSRGVKHVQLLTRTVSVLTDCD